MKKYYTYITTNKKYGVLYTGVTSDIIRRIYQHKNKFVSGFSKKYNTDKLIYYEEYIDPKEAILREKRIKRWKRIWKIELIEKDNPDWEDLYFDLI